MLVIRLQRKGRKNRVNFRVVVAEKSAHVSKKFKEVLGSYNPHTKELSLRNPEKIQGLIEQGVQPSPTVNNLLIDKGIIKGEKVKAFNIPKKEEPKVEEAKPAQAPAAEAPAEEKPVEAAPEEAAPSEEAKAE
jgi:small subunit ribosomal protein S16